MIESSKPIASLQNFGIRKMDKKKMRRKHLSEMMGSLKSYVCLVGNKDININIPLSRRLVHDWCLKDVDFFGSTKFLKKGRSPPTARRIYVLFLGTLKRFPLEVEVDSPCLPECFFLQTVKTALL